ncbi:MAG TPA: nicotinamide-nucleotide amidohydrolase family protein [Burkholderiaceae bacterium]|nr:nicotinamide-nucleotide amidohydrolase family protein [Burkholderiaceae bacterium]
MSAAPDGDDAVLAAGAALGARLLEAGLAVATAESCTGGLAARALTGTSGSAAWVERGFVTYSNEAKREALGVSEAALAAHGAVSEPVAREMALGALARSRAALSIAVTGIAGPTGAVPGKPVGTVCFGWALRAPGLAEDAPQVRVETLRFDGDRAAVRRGAARHALDRARAWLEAELADRPPAA